MDNNGPRCSKCIYYRTVMSNQGTWDWCTKEEPNPKCSEKNLDRTCTDYQRINTPKHYMEYQLKGYW